MIKYKDILSEITSHGNIIITIIRDGDIINDDFILLLEKDLAKNYKIEKQRFDIENIEEDSVIFIQFDKKIEHEIFDQMNINVHLSKKKIIVIVIRNYFQTTNTSLVPGVAGYVSSLIFLLKNKRLKLLKSRYSTSTDFIDMKNLILVQLRKIKLQNLNSK